MQQTTQKLLAQTQEEQKANSQNGARDGLNEEQCELLTEILSILYKTVNRLD